MLPPGLARVRAGWLLLALWLVASIACGPSDPKQRQLQDEASYLESLTRNSVVRNLASQGRDGQAIRPSDVVGAMYSTAAAASLPVRQRPQGEKVLVVSGPGRPDRPWAVGVIPDDDQGVILFEGYGDNVDRPLFVRKVSVP